MEQNIKASSNTLLGFAVLRANYNANAPSYLDGFRPFILSVLAESSRPYLERDQISATIRDQFGIDIPALVVKSLLRSTNKIGITAKVGETAVEITPSGLESAPALQQQITEYNRHQADLVKAFESFVDEKFPEQRSHIADASAMLLAEYFQRHAAPLLNEGLRNRKSVNTASEAGVDFIIASFVTHLAANDQNRFGYVVEAAKGAMLSAVLLLDSTELKNSLDNLTLVLDTPVLMDALGFHGELPEIATMQLISMALQQSAKVVTFEHCVDELSGILEHVGQALRKGHRSKSTSAGYLHFVDIGATPADVMLLQGKLPELLEGAGIQVIPRPDGYYQYGLDEGKLEDLIQSKVNYFQDAARVNDVLSLSSTHRLRKGTRNRALELCRAVLVTTNVNLVWGAVAFEESKASFPLAVMTDAVASVLWVRSPAAAPDAPREMLLASAYSGMQPSPAIWTRYLEEVDALEQSSAVTADEAVILRTSRTSREALMDETLGESEAVDAESPLVVLERVRREATAPLADQVRQLEERAAKADEVANTAAASWLEHVDAREKAESERDAALEAAAQTEQDLRAIRAADEAKLINIRHRAQIVGRRWRLATLWTFRLAGVAVTITATIVFLNLPDPADRTGVVIVGVAGLVALLVLFLPPAGSILDALEHRVARTSERRRLSVLGYALDQNGPMPRPSKSLLD